MYLSSFLGRTVSNVIVEDKHTVFKFSEFSMIFLSAVETRDNLERFVGQKFLYIQKYPEVVYFHFSGTINFWLKIDSNLGTVPQFIMLKNKDKEVLLRVDDGKTFEGI